MKKILIPTILAATVLVAGIFAMMPVQKAATIHSSLGAQTGATTGAVAATPAFTTILTATNAGVVWISCTAVADGTDGQVQAFVGGVYTGVDPIVGSAVAFAINAGQAVQLQDSNAATADATATCRATVLK